MCHVIWHVFRFHDFITPNTNVIRLILDNENKVIQIFNPHNLDCQKIVITHTTLNIHILVAKLKHKKSKKHEYHLWLVRDDNQNPRPIPATLTHSSRWEKKEQRKYGEKKERKQRSREGERGNDENNLHVVKTLNIHNKRQRISLTIKIKKHKITNKWKDATKNQDPLSNTCTKRKNNQKREACVVWKEY
jgi:hypothetical protein